MRALGELKRALLKRREQLHGRLMEELQTQLFLRDPETRCDWKGKKERKRKAKKIQKILSYFNHSQNKYLVLRFFKKVNHLRCT